MKHQPQHFIKVTKNINYIKPREGVTDFQIRIYIANSDYVSLI